MEFGSKAKQKALDYVSYKVVAYLCVIYTLVIHALCDIYILACQKNFAYSQLRISKYEPQVHHLHDQ